MDKTLPPMPTIQQEHLKRMFVGWLDKTIATKENHHMANMYAGTCVFTINFSVNQIPNTEVVISETIEEAISLVDDLTSGLLTPSMFRFMLATVKGYSKTEPKIFMFNQTMFIVSDVITIVIIKESGRSYEATVAGATIQ